MKKKIVCILLAIVTFLFSGCVFIPVKNVVHSDPNKVTAIEVYYLEEWVLWDKTEKYWYKMQWNEVTSSDDIIVYDYQPIGCVKPEDYADFIADAKALPYKLVILLIPAAIDPMFGYNGYVVRIVSDDGEEFLECEYGLYDKNCDETVWQDFLKKYIGEEAFAK